MYNDTDYMQDFIRPVPHNVCDNYCRGTVTPVSVVCSTSFTPPTVNRLSVINYLWALHVRPSQQQAQLETEWLVAGPSSGLQRHLGSCPFIFPLGNLKWTERFQTNLHLQIGVAMAGYSKTDLKVRFPAPECLPPHAGCLTKVLGCK